MASTMKDMDLQRIASNNPAMTVPASQYIPRAPKNIGSRNDTTTSRTTAGQLQQRQQQQQHQQREIQVSDPAGDVSHQVLPSNTLKSSLSTTPTSTSTSPEYTSQQDEEEISKYDRGWRRVVRNFSPSWFSMTMGTGIVSLLFIAIPWRASWLYWFAVAFFALNTILFSLAFSISVARYTFYPEIWSVMIRDSTNSLFLGTVPMGLATLVEAWTALCCPYWGNWSVSFAWALWMLDSAVSVTVTMSLSFLLISSSHQQSLDRITAAQLLPIAATIVAAGGGARLSEQLMRLDPQYALGTTITSYVMWGMSTPLALTVLVMYYQRLALHKLPPREIVVSSFLPLGPLGMGGWTIMYLGKVSRDLLPHVGFLSQIPLAGDIFYMLGIFTALIMWSFGLLWGVFAIATISTCPNGFPFNMGWWGFTFPLGVFAISTIQLGVEMPSLFFRVLGSIFAVMVMILWVVVAAGTLRGAWDGHLFYAPCLKNLPPRGQDVNGGHSGHVQDKEKQSEGSDGSIV